LSTINFKYNYLRKLFNFAVKGCNKPKNHLLKNRNTHPDRLILTPGPSPKERGVVPTGQPTKKKSKGTLRGCSLSFGEG
jgi:hypothetical protein